MCHRRENPSPLTSTKYISLLYSGGQVVWVITIIITQPKQSNLGVYSSIHLVQKLKAPEGARSRI